MMMRSNRTGFTLIFVIVITAVIAVLFATVGTTLVANNNTARAQTTITMLQSIAHGDTLYFTADGSYPFRVAELSSPVVKGNAAYTNSCGGANTLATSDVTAWNNNGPYISFLSNANVKQGVYTPVGWMNDTMIRNPAGGGAGFLEIQINGISTADAATIDLLVDGVRDSSTGTVRFTIPVNDTATLTYWVPIGNKC